MTVVHLKNTSKKSTLKKKSELKKENVSRILGENKISTKLLGKRHSIPHENIRIPFFNINISSKIFYSSIGSKIVRLARDNSNCLTFIMQVNTLSDRMSK